LGERSDAQLKNGLITTLVMVCPSESIIGGVPPEAGSAALRSYE
jgi:hypothetical protein